MATAISTDPKPAIRDHGPQSTDSSQTVNHSLNPFEEIDDNPFNPQDLTNLKSPKILIETVADRGEEQHNAAAKPLKSQPNDFTLKKLLLSPQAAIVLMLALGSVYALTRPCVIGECGAIDEAKSYSQGAEEILQTVSSAKAPGLAKQDIDAAIAELEKIPFWSPYYGPARRLLSNYRQESNELGAVVAGLRLAGLASQKGQNPPHTVPEWETLKNLWEEAIAQLQQVPLESLIYPFAQERLNQYQDAVTEVRGRLILEREAQDTLLIAKQAAQVATARQGVATQADSWQLVYDTWQQAANTLASIPVGTTAHQDAQLLLARYQPKLEAARDRKTIEQVGQEAYNRAVNSAEQAEILSGRGAWSEAVKYWSRAVSYGKKIPQTSSSATEMKPLMTSYTQSWQQAEAQNKLTNRINKARQDLKKTCGGSLAICSYSVNQDLITVRITPAYLEKIETTATQGDQAGNEKQRSEAEKHVQTLKIALETISDNAQIPLEVYKPDGKKIGVHIPQ
ncbi:MAG: hypothetical protein WBA13_19220 [Microcoleaceae cyanobacterium]